MGRFAFCLSVVVVLSIFFEFGISSAGARVLALSRDRNSERQALGALALLTIAIGVVFSLFIASVATPIDLLFNKDVRWLLAATAVFAFFHPFQTFIEQSCQGLNHIRRLSIFQLLMSGSYLLGLIVLVALGRLTAGAALGAYLAAIGLASLWTLLRMRPIFSGASSYIKLTLKETRGYGFNLYLARISGMVSSRSDQLAIGYFLADTAPLGMYAIAQKFSNPIAMIGRSMAVTRFRAFARIARVPGRITRWNAIALVAAAVGLVVVGPIALRLFFPKYASAAPLLVPFAAMNLFVGLFQPYNMFLASQGKGAELRNIVLIVGSATVAALIVTVPRYEIAGAAWTVAAAMALDYVLHYYYYRKVVSAQERKRPNGAGFCERSSARSGALNSRSTVLLDLSGNRGAAMEWAASQAPPNEITEVNKADLKWISKSEALANVRALRPEVFLLFSPDLRLQSTRKAITMFAVLAGARRVVIGDYRGSTKSVTRLRALLIEAPRFAFEWLFGYGFIVPMSWLLTEALRLALVFRGPSRASLGAGGEYERDPHRSLEALYIRATLSTVSEGGASSHVAGFAGGAAALGHRVKFLTCSTRQDDSRDLPIAPSSLFGPNKTIFELWNNLVFTIKSLRSVTSESDKFDFIYQRYSRFNWTGVALSMISGLPLVLEYNGSEVWIGRQWDPIGQLSLLKRFERLNQRAADMIVVVSDVERRNLIEARVAASRILVNPNGVDVDKFRPGCGGNEIKRSLGIADKMVVGFIGTFGPWHGAPVLAEAARLTSSHAGYHFLFMGDGDERAKAESIISSAGVSATFTGRLPHDVVPAYLDCCDVLISPHVPLNDGREFFGSPTKLFEYMAMAKPIVASRLGQIADVITDRENGLLVEPGNPNALAQAIELLAQDDALRIRLGTNARSTVVESYTWKQNASRVFAATKALSRKR